LKYPDAGYLYNLSPDHSGFPVQKLSIADISRSSRLRVRQNPKDFDFSREDVKDAKKFPAVK